MIRIMARPREGAQARPSRDVRGRGPRLGLGTLVDVVGSGVDVGHSHQIITVKAPAFFKGQLMFCGNKREKIFILG